MNADATPNAEPAPRAGLGVACALAAALVFLTCGYFQNSRPGWNVNSQLALTAAVAERGALSIDAYHEHPAFATGDKAFFEGRFYSDKSPVTPFMGVPAFAAYRAAAAISGDEIDYAAARYWTTWITCGGSAAALAWMLAVFLARSGVEPTRAAAVAALWIAATPLLGYSVIFFNYLPACALAMGGWMLVDSTLRETTGGVPPPPIAPSRLFLAGALVGLAAWALSTFGVLALLMTAALAWRASRASGGLRAVLRLWPWAAGGLLAVAGYALYSFAIFGQVTNPYRYEFDENFRKKMAEGLMGAGAPSLRVLWMITFHPFRGLFTLFPAALLAALGLVYLLARPRAEPAASPLAAAVALLFLAALLIYNSGYFMWWGGWSYAPRHLIPALPLMVLGLAPWAARGAGAANSRFFALLAVLILGAVANAAAISLDPQVPPGLPEEILYRPELVETWPNPFLDLLRYVWRGQTDANWGTRMGLSGPASLAPLFLIWIAGLAAIFASARTTNHEATTNAK